jgi:hypothetical protein
MKLSGRLSCSGWRCCAKSPMWNCGMPTSAEWKATRARVGAGRRGGSRPRVPYLGDHIRANVVGAVCPATGHCFAMVFDAMNTDCFQCFLDQLAQTIPPEPGKRRMLLLDNASWHKAQRLQWHHFQHQFLPTYSPDFNPIERLWLRLKADYFSDFIARTPQQLTERLLSALKAFIDDPSTVASQCATRK